MSSVEFIEWIAYYRLEPWGYEADNWRAGMIASVIANANRKKGKKAYKPTDFMPEEPPDRPRSRAIDDTVLRAKLDGVMAAWGGTRATE
jgi:hypothetical protein